MSSWVLPTFVIVAAVSLFLQMLIFAALFFQVRRIGRRIEALMDDVQRRVTPVISRVQMLVEDAQPRISNMIADAAEMTHMARGQVQRVDRMVTEAVDRLRMQLIHADQILTGAMEAVEETGARIRSSVLRPVISVTALVRGIQTGLEFYRGRRCRQPTHGPAETEDEELFI
jgi:hypothetical protein